ncbi:hypothetical protein [Agrobacterium vaccinii]|nr:hypothetical protein [Agrobacterium vaccinii]
MAINDLPQFAESDWQRIELMIENADTKKPGANDARFYIFI